MSNYLLRDVGTAQGHMWPVNYYIKSVEDERIPYGLQLSPMTNTTPVGFDQFPVAQTTTLFDELPIETVSLSTGDEIELPIRYTESTVINAFFEADRAVVETKLENTPFQLAMSNGSLTVVGLGFFEYRESNIGPYSEVGLVIPVVLKGDPLPSNWLVDLVLPPLDRKMGFYVLNIPADDAVAVAAGKEIWGFTKFVTDVDFHHAGSSIDMTVHDPNSNDTILNFVGDVGSGIAIPAMSSLTMSELNGVPMKTINYASGTAYTILNYQLLLTVGESQHPMAQNLRDIGVDGAAPTMLTVSTDYQSVLYFGEPM